VLILRLRGRWLAVWLRIGSYSSTDCRAQRATQDSAVATANFVTNRCTSRATDAATYGGIDR
jgi:hypothetical protein